MYALATDHAFSPQHGFPRFRTEGAPNLTIFLRLDYSEQPDRAFPKPLTLSFHKRFEAGLIIEGSSPRLA